MSIQGSVANSPAGIAPGSALPSGLPSAVATPVGGERLPPLEGADEAEAGGNGPGSNELDPLAVTGFPGGEGSLEYSRQTHPAEAELSAEQQYMVAQYAQQQYALPFHPPGPVQRWLRQDDWDALAQAYHQVEMQAYHWESGHGAHGFDAMDYELQRHREMLMHRRRRRPKRPGWDDRHHLIPLDAKAPPPLRRYFDAVPSENSERRPAPQHPLVKCDIEVQDSRIRAADPSESKRLLDVEKQWCDSHHRNVTDDNPGLHPHLRHYFDRRGLESSYRQRPHLENEPKVHRPRTPQRPSTREKILKWRSLSEPQLTDEMDVSNRHHGAITWGRRCLLVGPDPKVKEGPGGSKIPWVNDFHRSESEDNEILNPLLRHYLDKDGLESSFRNRGRHYGRSLPKIKAFGDMDEEDLSPGGMSLTSKGSRTGFHQRRSTQSMRSSVGGGRKGGSRMSTSSRSSSVFQQVPGFA